jgi:hypothetical protein
VDTRRKARRKGERERGERGAFAVGANFDSRFSSREAAKNAKEKAV